MKNWRTTVIGLISLIFSVLVGYNEMTAQEAASMNELAPAFVAFIAGIAQILSADGKNVEKKSESQKSVSNLTKLIILLVVSSYFIGHSKQREKKTLEIPKQEVKHIAFMYNSAPPHDLSFRLLYA